MKKLLTICIIALMMALTACTTTSAPAEETPTPTEATGVVETFGAEYEMVGTTSSGNPKNDTFIFNGETTDGIITSLEFEIIRNKGLDSEYSKTDIMGYLMNISDILIEEVDGKLVLTNLSAFGYDADYAEGAAAQFMVNATTDVLTAETTFKDLTFTNYATGGTDEVVLEKALVAFNGLAMEAGLAGITEDTLVKDLVAVHGLYKDNAFMAGEGRVSFEGVAGGRSYGEQIQAIEDHILANNMTLEDVLEMFKTVNQSSEAIEERDTVSGATITFVGDFQRMMHYVIDGEIFQGVVNTTANDDGTTTYEVVTQGYAGEIETKITIDAEGNVTQIDVRDENETPEYGGALIAEEDGFLTTLLENQADTTLVDTKTGSTATANALVNAVNYAKEAFSAE